ncbi:hypothetical protein CLOSTMETH_00412 [[Clostridium] methylpentosum DSM 5476]|uniref:Uncharacterized protein n=1 Tax=[Clostridium] methylpentosum DSM 5476 TaxID=537013 RepID=C0E9B4_9FIRM|nr:hypothetical protein CLOSTMETH_00412 [[Clostridium] methylpentosum DSM 5476]
MICEKYPELSETGNFGAEDIVWKPSRRMRRRWRGTTISTGREQGRRTTDDEEFLNPFIGNKWQNFRGWQIVFARRDAQAKNIGLCPHIKNLRLYWGFLIRQSVDTARQIPPRHPSTANDTGYFLKILRDTIQLGLFARCLKAYPTA